MAFMAISWPLIGAGRLPPNGLAVAHGPAAPNGGSPLPPFELGEARRPPPFHQLNWSYALWGHRVSARQGPRVFAACSTGGFSPTAVSIGGMLNHRLIWRFPDIPPFQLAVAISTGGSRLFLQIMYPKIYFCKIVKKEI